MNNTPRVSRRRCFEIGVFRHLRGGRVLLCQGVAPAVVVVDGRGRAVLVALVLAGRVEVVYCGLRGGLAAAAMEAAVRLAWAEGLLG